jgi:hypothetical protein
MESAIQQVAVLQRVRSVGVKHSSSFLRIILGILEGNIARVVVIVVLLSWTFATGRRAPSYGNGRRPATAACCRLGRLMARSWPSEASTGHNLECGYYSCPPAAPCP